MQYTGNAQSGHNYGLESELSWHVAHNLDFGAALGLLNTQFQNFAQLGTALSTVERELPNSPHWQAAVNATYRNAGGAFARLDATGMGSYYFDLPPNWTRSSPYGLLNAKVGYQPERWTVDVYMRNMLNKRYPVRGFYFGDVPPNFANELYIQLGDPRTFGASVSVRFGALAH